MRFTLKLLANLTDARDGDAMDKLINSLSRDCARRMINFRNLGKGS